MIKFDCLTLFPKMVGSILSDSILKRAIENKLLEVNFIDFRSFSKMKHKNVDDSPYGGGAGMVLMAPPIYEAIHSINDNDKAFKILLTPQGEKYTEKTAKMLASKEHIILICGHYEGFDERIRSFADMELSIGDYVLTGGEIAAMAITDAIIRLIPGVLKKPEATQKESFSKVDKKAFLEYPQYTRPENFQNLSVPRILLSGNHKKITLWQKYQAQKITKKNRPDLLKK